MVRQPTPIDWARLAAFLDGEGSIRVAIQKRSVRWKPTRKLPSMTLSISVYNTDPRLMVWLSKTFGGRPVENTHSTSRKRPVYKWHAFAKEREWILTECLPFFIIKRQQAELGLAFLKVFSNPGRYERTSEQAKKQESFARTINVLNLTRER